MTGSNKDKNYRAKSNVEPDLDNETLEAKIEPEYIIQRFYEISPLYATFDLIFAGVYLFLFNFMPGTRHAAFVSIVFFLSHFVLCTYVGRCKGTKDQESLMKWFGNTTRLFGFIHEIFQVSNDSLSSEEGRSAHVSMVILTIYFLGTCFTRISWPRHKEDKEGAFFGVLFMPLIVLKYPRFGVFSPRCEALAFFLAIGLGVLIGEAFDEMRWRHFISMHKKELEIKKKSKELLEITRKRQMVVEALSSYEQARWVA